MDYYNHIQNPAYRIYAFTGDDGQGTGDQGTGDQGTGDQGTGDQGTGDQGTGGGSGGSTDPDIEAIIKERTKKHQTVVDGLRAEVKALSEKSSLTAKERQELEQRVTELNNKLLTKEELAKQDKDRLTKTHNEERERLAKEAELWQSRYEETRINSALTDAAVKNEAYNPKQLVTLLRGNTRISEVEEGSGNFDVRIQLESTNDKGEPVTLDLNPEEAIKHMSEQEDYANLFKSNSTGGFGGHRSQSGGKLDVAALATDPAAYRAARKAGKV